MECRGITFNCPYIARVPPAVSLYLPVSLTRLQFSAAAWSRANVSRCTCSWEAGRSCYSGNRGSGRSAGCIAVDGKYQV